MKNVFITKVVEFPNAKNCLYLDWVQHTVVFGVQKRVDGLENISDKLSSVGQFGFWKYAKYVLLSDCWTANCANGWMVLCPTVQ